MIKIHNITMKNFMSVGNVTQVVDFQDSGLTLVLGNNMDLGGDGSRNGVGKTTLINALSYALYGAALSKIKVNNLINKTNSKGMFVSVDFSVNGTNYRIERGRKRNIFRYLVDDHEVLDSKTDDTQGVGRDTQADIEKLFGMNHLMFKHIIALNTYNEPFLSLGAGDQRSIIEHLLGITVLSEKAELLKELLRITKDNIKEEDYRIKGVETANEQINKSIRDLGRRKRIWIKQNEDDTTKLEKQIEDFKEFDIESELESHIALDVYRRKQSEISDLDRTIANLTGSIQREERRKVKAEKDLQDTLDHKCYACGQEIHDEKHEEILSSKTAAVTECAKLIQDDNDDIKLCQVELDGIGALDTMPVTKYNTAQEAYEYQSQLTTLETNLTGLLKATDPYTDQIETLEKDGLQEVSWDEMNNLHNLREHQDFLYKLLTNKDSFVRKRIIEQNLVYLNSRLNYYLTKLGLPHEVVFQSDLNVEITELGRELDFDNLSRGERNRLILGLSWSFRDVHESMNTEIDFMAIDELIDSGMDSNGVESALLVLKKMHRDRNKNIFLISHREELIGRVNNILYVIKENGFTSFSPNQEFDIA